MKTLQVETVTLQDGSRMDVIRDIAAVRKMADELQAYRQGGLTEEILRRNDGYIKVGNGCAIVVASHIPNTQGHGLSPVQSDNQ